MVMKLYKKRFLNRFINQNSLVFLDNQNYTSSSYYE